MVQFEKNYLMEGLQKFMLVTGPIITEMEKENIFIKLATYIMVNGKIIYVMV